MEDRRIYKAKIQTIARRVAMAWIEHSRGADQAGAEGREEDAFFHAFIANAINVTALDPDNREIAKAIQKAAKRHDL